MVTYDYPVFAAKPTDVLIKPANIVAGKTYRQQNQNVAMTVLWIMPTYRLNTGASIISRHRRARVRFADGSIGIGKFYATQSYIEVKGE